MKKINIILLSALMAILCLMPSGGSTARAASTMLAFDKTNVLDDLRSSTINGEPFDLKDYPYSTTTKPAEPKILSFIEYCYSYKENMQKNYGLYIYFYNPKSLNIDTDNYGNKIQIATSYTMKDGVRVADDYEKFDLQFCSMSTESDYFGLFYKFKVVDHIAEKNSMSILDRIGADLETQQAAGITINECERRYDISGVYLVEEDKPNANAYSVGYTFKFTGYAKGYGADVNAESSLNCSTKELKFLELKLKHTFYRTESSAAGKGHQNELNTVYFAIDKNVIEEYGRLQIVKAEWWEYKTTSMIITDKKSVSDAMQSYMGRDVKNYDTSVPYGFTSVDYSMMGDKTIYDWAYNGYWKTGYGEGEISAQDKDSILYYMLFTADKLSSDQLSSYVLNYNKTYVKGELPIKDNLISADLFMDTVDDGRIRGYNCKDINADGKYDLLSYSDSNKGFWDKVGDYGFWDTLFNNIPSDNSITVKPIEEVRAEHLNGSNKTISENLLINENDVNDFKTYFNDETKPTGDFKKGKTVYLFRYAVTDYFAQNLHIKNGSKTIDGNAYRAQASVFMDFNIIHLTFYKDGVYTVIPVVANPIDVFNAPNPPIDFGSENNIFSWLKWVLLGIAILILIPLFIWLLVRFPKIAAALLNLLIFLGEGVLFILLLPYRIIHGIVRTVKNKKAAKEQAAKAAKSETEQKSNAAKSGGAKRKKTTKKSKNKKTIKKSKKTAAYKKKYKKPYSSQKRNYTYDSYNKYKKNNKNR